MNLSSGSTDKIMVSKEATVQVACCVFADGSITFTLNDQTSINTARQKWLESRTEVQAAKHRKHETMGGAVVIKMLAEDWHMIQKEQLRE